MTTLAFIDTETTGLDADQHEIWEVGMILRGEHGDELQGHWFLPVDLGRADPVALRIGGYHERIVDEVVAASCRPFAEEFARLTRGAHLVGNVVSFDEERLRKLLQRNGACPEWHYHLIDVEPLVVGFLSGARYGPTPVGPTITPPWKSDDLTRAMGLDPDAYEKHTALGDAQWARDLYDAAMKGPTP